MAMTGAAISCYSRAEARQTVLGVRRTLVDGGKFLCSPYSDRHSIHASGQRRRDGLVCMTTLRGHSWEVGRSASPEGRQWRLCSPVVGSWEACSTLRSSS